ncbi:aldo/keto reductase [Nocardioides sp. Kera G14]|uniref:aldo/keto reductase n=1 Tax=Nocardioides sp. Kera G14 TaxID=2884264 RepID=UPI001D113B76|nr:aldo/keto reductase [Nocardioides sp. Kera G14]UDY25170.1 aldo/keto reductase [Nocardioides sp. Kera G14]
MQQRPVGVSGLQVSSLGLGTMTWGRTTDEHEAREQLTRFLDAGGTLVDTAHVYNEGASETMLGALIADLGARDDVVLATKAGITSRTGERRLDTSRRTLLDDLDTSLRRLRTERIDLWQVHVWTDQTPLEETLAALEQAVTSGKVHYVGISNYNGWQTARAATLLEGSAAPIVSTQVQYSLLARDSEDEVLPAAAALGVGVLPWSPLASGVLTGKYRTGTPSDSRAADSTYGQHVHTYLDDRSQGIVGAVARAAEGLGWTPAEVALAWVRDRPGVTAPILGARTSAQLKALLGVADKNLPPEITAALDDVSDI